MFLDSLEMRRLFAFAGFVPPDSVLRITGHEGNDSIAIGKSGDLIFINHNVSTPLGDLMEMSAVDYVAYDLPSVKRIEIDGKAGDDRIEISKKLKIPSLLIGDIGSDTLIGGGGADTLRGGDGNDTLSGADGNDLLRGGNGDDQLDDGPHQVLGVIDLFRGEPFEGDPTGDDDMLFGDNGRDTLVTNFGRDQLDGGAGSDAGTLVAIPENLANVERFPTSTDTLSYTPVPALAGSFGSLLNVYKNPNGECILQTSLRLSDGGWAIDWDLRRDETKYIITPTFFRTNGAAGQALTNYSRNFNLGHLANSRYEFTLRHGDIFYAGKVVNVGPGFKGEPVAINRLG